MVVVLVLVAGLGREAVPGRREMGMSSSLKHRLGVGREWQSEADPAGREGGCRVARGYRAQEHE